MTLLKKCPTCVEMVKPDSDGNCPNCRLNLVAIDKNPNQEIQFYCAVCEDFFMSVRDGTGFEQAPCPKCGDLSNTPAFHVGEMIRNKESAAAGANWLLWLILSLLLSGVGWFLKSIFVAP